MKNLLYVSFENSENRASGVNKKISGQIKAFEEEGFAVDLIARYQNSIALFHGDSEAKILKKNTAWRISLCDWAARRAQQYDVAYIRFQFFCPFVLKMVRSLYKANVRTVMEIPTYPYNTELKKQGLRGIPKRLIDETFRNFCAKYIGSFAAPLYDTPIMGKPCIEIRNGIDMDEVNKRIPVKNDGKIHLLAVAMMAPWHGYDRMIEGLHNYYANGGKEEIILHLVGKGVASETYKDLIVKYNLANHVIEHGKLHGEALDKMYDIADIGVGSLGIHRTEIKKTNTLKIMEYMAKGIPVICEHSEYGIPVDSPYRLTVADDDSPINIDRVLKFYEGVYAGTDTDRITSEIREECKHSCNTKAGLSGILSYMAQ